MSQTRQNSLFQENSAKGGSVVAIAGSTKALNRIQRRFNLLIARLHDQRQQLAQWKAFQQEFQERIARDYHPLTAQLRQKQVAMARLLDRTLDGKGLGSLQRRKVFEIFSNLVQGLLADEHDEELVQLYDKHADASFAEERQLEVDAMSAFASQAFGIDTQGYAGGADPQELADWISERIDGAEPDPEPSPRAQRKSGGSGAAPAGVKAAESGTRALREVFRKLVSELHPDREADTAERARKNDLMKEVNRAYAAGDLLRLLEIQLDIAQINSADVANLAEDKLRRYIHVFEEQSRQLNAEVAEILEPFATVIRRSSKPLTPDVIRQSLTADIQSLKNHLRDIAAELDRFADIRQLKESLRLYRLNR